MLIKLNGVSLKELESALKYSGLYVQHEAFEGDHCFYDAEIKAIPPSYLHDDVRIMDRLKESLEKSRNFEKSEVSDDK